jgi:iron(III) transport system ATP-binding protein
VLLFDEPLSNLDARLRRRVRDEIRGLQQRLGVSVVYVTHDREEALAVSDRIIVMDQGRVAESGPPGELFAAPRTAFVADFLAEANLAAARLAAVAGELAEVDVAGHVVRVPHRGNRPGPVTVAIRPDAVQVDDGGSGITGRILRAAFVGRAIEYTIDTAAGELFAICPATASLRAPGAPVTVQLAPTGVTIVDAAPRNASA